MSEVTSVAESKVVKSEQQYLKQQESHHGPEHYREPVTRKVLLQAAGNQAREWLHLDAHGETSLIMVDKHSLVSELGVPYRDLRMLDPLVPLPYPSALFVREKAMVVNLESVRMLVTKNQVYVLSIPSEHSGDMGAPPDVDSPFVQDLILRIKAGEVDKDGSPLHRESMRMQLDRQLPYELRAVECALCTVTRMLSRECAELEASALHPLERLSHRVNRGDLEDVRNIKTHLNKLLGRVRKIKLELEKLLNDDEDMADMYLGRKEELENAKAEALTHASSIPLSPRASLVNDISFRYGFGSLGAQERSTPRAVPAPKADRSEEDAAPDPFQPGSLDSNAEVLRKLDELHRQSLRMPNLAEEINVDLAEALLENYLHQIDFLLSGLMQLKERIDDTEDLINIELDQRRNDIVSLDLLVTIGAFALTFLTCVAGIFGMNLAPLPITASHHAFWTVIATSCGLTLIIFYTIVTYARYRGLLFLTSPLNMSVTHFEKRK